MDVFRAFLIVIWLLSPLIVLLLYVWGQRQSIRGWGTWAWLSAASVAINWTAFTVLLIRSQTPYGMIFQTSVLTHVLTVMSCAGVVLCAKNWRLLLANTALITFWITIAYAPAHWMSSRGPGTVRINGQQVSSTVYFGHPTDSEAEEVALVEIPGAEDYFLSFETEKIRHATNRDFVHLPCGIWVFKSLRRMSFSEEPLPSKEENQLRVASSDGRVIEVQF
jgi:hypothetical protein